MTHPTEDVGTENMTRSRKSTGCKYCAGEAEPGWIEMDNNGPIVRCPVCERREQLKGAACPKM